MCFKSHFFQLSMISTLLVTSLSIGMANNNPNLNKTNSSATQAQEIKQDVPAAIKGSDTPTLIPDSAAYDLFLRSLADGVAAPDVEERRKSIQASKTGVKGNNSGRLISIAQEFGNRAAALDRRAAVIKDKVLPTPSIQDVAQLEKLQKEREELIIEFVTAIETRLGADDADKLKQYILNEVKKNITAIQIPQRADNHTNHKKIGKLIPASRDSLFGGQVHSLFPTATSSMPMIQYGMGGYAYVST